MSFDDFCSSAGIKTLNLAKIIYPCVTDTPCYNGVYVRLTRSLPKRAKVVIQKFLILICKMLKNK